MSLKKIDTKDIKLIKEFGNNVEEFNGFNENFYEIFRKGNFIKRLFLKQNFRCIKYENRILGYIWWKNIDIDTLEIKSFYIKEEEIREDIIEILKLELKLYNKNIIYETFSKNKLPNILLKLNFSKESSIEVMCIKKSSKFEEEELKKIKFKKLKKNKDEETRCKLQNNIFEEEERIPLTLNDIYYDECQDYYIEELSIMMEYDEIPIGYGQIIKNKSEYILVNFGIIKEFRCKGYGNKLLKYIINLCIENDINEIYLRVGEDNIPAKKLYKSIGFRYFGKIIKWKIKKATK